MELFLDDFLNRGFDSPEGWALQDAKAKFSELFRQARVAGPQKVTKHGKEAVMVIAYEEYERLACRQNEPQTLSQFFAQSPLAGVELDLERDQDPGREIDVV